MDKFLNLTVLTHFWGRIKAKLDGKQDTLVSGTNIKTINNENLLGSGNIDIHGDDVFVAVYEQTTYADVTAAIGANKVILLDMPANNNQFCITFSAYTNGGNAVMYAIFKMNNRSTLMTATLTPADHWTVAHTDLQEKLESGTSIKTINNQSLLGSGNIDIGGGGGGDDEIGYIVYNTTTFDEAAEILNNHKICAFKYTNQVGTVPIVHKFVSSNEIAFQFFSGNHSTTQLYIAPTYFTCRIYKEGTVTKWAFNSNALQPILSSGNTIKTINNQSILGAGNLNIGGGTVDTAMSDTSENAVQNKVIKSYVDTADANLQSQLGTLTDLTTDNKDSLVNAINEVYEKSGEPFRVKQWGNNALNVEIPTCTEDISNTAIPKMVFSIDNVEGADYQIVGMLAYEVFDATSGGNRINCWPVCQFTGNGQKELSVRWMCGGTTRKTAKRINAWVLLKHR